MSTIAWIGFSQGLFAAILMFTKKDSSASDKILSAWLFLLGIKFFTCGLDYELFGQPLLSSSLLLFNPALYLYVKTLTRPDYKLKLYQLLHLLPFILFEISAYLIQEPLSIRSFFESDSNFIYRMLFGIANIASWSFYNPMSLILVHKHRMALRNEISTIEKNENLGWLLGISIFYVVYCIVAFILSAFVFSSTINPLTPHIYNYSVLLFFSYTLSFYGLRQQKIIIKYQKPEVNKTPYQNSQLSEERKQVIQKRLIEYFEQKKAYLNPELNMELLSANLRIPKYQLTEVLSTEIGKNFFQFVNSYRVEAVKKMLADPKNHFSVEATGYECGFTSKSSFYNVFKSFTGMTPFEFRNQQLKN